MTSAADFHILSLRNILGLLAVGVAVLIPVGLKRAFRNDLGDLGQAEEVLEEVEDVNAVRVEVGVEGIERRYQAVDSGVVLAGPSSGDGSLDVDARHGFRGKGKGKMVDVHLIANIQEDANEQDEREFDLYEPGKRVEYVTVEKIKKYEIPATRGYGALENTGRSAMEGRGNGSGVW
jgi:hypothetical protein